ncbi:MAG TPA: AtpZ/AtpI family protein [Candidatus Eremiobacteraceae bacterium]|nr:AtpZ/AtpI family protein [Candidatus Eremiobacteraceae bacterium]
MNPKASSYLQLAGAGSSIVGTLVVGLLLGLAAARYLHWEWAAPVGLILGFVAGIVSAYRRFTSS